MTTYNSLTVEDLIVKRLWVEHKRIDTINLGSLVVSDPLYNVGIGTDNPELRLDIIGTSAIRIPVGNNTIERPDMSTITNKHGIFRYNSSDKTYETYFLNKWRSLGGSQLELSTESTVNKPTIILNKQGLTTSDAGASIEFKLEDASNPDTLHQKQAQILVKNGGASNTGNIHFQTANGSDSYNDRMIIKKDGKVGIGLNPLSTLHIHEVNTSNNYVASNELGGKLILSYHNDYPAAAISSVTVNSGSYNGSMAFYTWRREGDPESSNIYSDDVGVPAKNIFYNAAGALVEAMRISHTGNVGIGINNPDSKLHIFEFSEDLNKSVLILEKNVNAYGNSTSGAILEFKTQKDQARKNQARIRGIDDVANNGDLGGLGFDYSSGFQGYKEGFRLSSEGYIGVNQQDPKVILDIDDTGAIQLPVGISTQRPSTLRKGMIRYNTTTDQFEGYGAGNAWGSLGGVKDIDQDTYITVSDGITDTDEIKFWTQNNERMIIDENGNVGIGTPSPSQKLEIELSTNNRVLFHTSGANGGGGGLMIGDTYNHATIPMFYVVNENSICHMGTRNNTDLSILTNWAHRIYIKKDGNVGIGTTKPYKKLDVEGDAMVQGHLHIGTVAESLDAINYGKYIYFDYIDENGYYGQRDAGGILFRGNENSNFDSVKYSGTVWQNYCAMYARIATNGNGSLAGTLRFLTRNDGSSGTTGMLERMTIRHDGNVGINTTSPGEKLEINGGNLLLKGNTPRIKFVSNNGSYGFQMIANHSDSNDYGFGIIPTPTGNTQALSILTNGNVGIGTNSPTYPLQIKGGSTSAKACQLMIENENYNKGIEFRYKSASGTTYDFPQAKIYTSNDTHSNPGKTSYDTSLHFSTAVGTTNANTAAVEVMTLDSAGNVGIGTTSPTALLDIQAPAGDTKLLRLGNERPWLFQSIRGNSSQASSSNLHLTSSTAAKWFYIDLDTSLDGQHNSGEGEPIFGVYTHTTDDKVYVRNKLEVDGDITADNITADKISLASNGVNIKDTNEIDSTSGLYLQYDTGADLNLCKGGGNVGIGKTTASSTDSIALRVQSHTKCNGQDCFEFLDEDGGVILAGRSYGTYEKSTGSGIRIGNHGSGYFLTGKFEVSI